MLRIRDRAKPPGEFASHRRTRPGEKQHQSRRAIIRLVRRKTGARTQPRLCYRAIETEETSASEATRLSPQCLCGSAQEHCREAFFDFTAQSKARSAEGVCVCWDDGNSGRSSI